MLALFKQPTLFDKPMTLPALPPQVTIVAQALTPTPQKWVHVGTSVEGNSAYLDLASIKTTREGWVQYWEWVQIANNPGDREAAGFMNLVYVDCSTQEFSTVVRRVFDSSGVAISGGFDRRLQRSLTFETLDLQSLKAAPAKRACSAIQQQLGWNNVQPNTIHSKFLAFQPRYRPDPSLGLAWR